MLRKFVTAVAAIVILTGCAPELKHLTRICPGKQSLSQSLDSLRLTSESIASLKATGRCNARFYVEDKKHRESFPITLWLNPPGQMRLHGDLFLNRRGIVLGSNEREFWLAMKPREISSYHWGLWSEQGSSGGLMISPKTVLEALGIVAIGGDESWSLSNEGPFDVLTQRNREGKITKKIYIYSCHYQTSKIEYYNTDGEVAIVADLYKYKEISEGFYAPRVIRLTTYAQDGRKDTFRFTLKSIKPYKFDREKQDIYFKRRPPKGFKHVYRIIDGSVIEQPQ